MKQMSPAAERNKAFIFEVLNPYLPREAKVLEIASGTGQHGAYICQERPDLHWQPTDIDPVSMASIAAFQAECWGTGMQTPLPFSIQNEPPRGILPPYDAMVNINMIHISPWKSCLGLMEQATRLLKPDGILYLYGPFLQDDVPIAPSNLEFDRSLQERNPEWGIRDLKVVTDEALKHGLHRLKVVVMPAYNLSLIFRFSGLTKRS